MCVCVCSRRFRPCPLRSEHEPSDAQSHLRCGGCARLSAVPRRPCQPCRVYGGRVEIGGPQRCHSASSTSAVVGALSRVQDRFANALGQTSRFSVLDLGPSALATASRAPRLPHREPRRNLPSEGAAHVHGSGPGRQVGSTLRARRMFLGVVNAARREAHGDSASSCADGSAYVVWRGRERESVGRTLGLEARPGRAWPKECVRPPLELGRQPPGRRLGGEQF